MKKLVLGIPILLVMFLLSSCTPKETVPTDVAQEVITDAVIAEGHILPKEDLHIAFLASGRVVESLVEKGDTVKAGQVLARLGDRDSAEQAVAAAKLDLTTAQQEIDRVVRTAGLANAQAWTAYLDAQVARAKAEEEWERLDLDQIDDDIEDAEEDVQDYLADLREAQQDFDKYKDLDKDSAKRQDAEDDLETAQEDYNESIRKLEKIIQKRDIKRAALDEAIQAQAEAKRAYENSLNQPDKDQFELADLNLTLAKNQLAAAEANLANYELTAPFDGTITEINYSLGEWLSSTTWAIGIADTREWYVETTDLSELDVIRIAVGQTVELNIDAIPGMSFTGTVTEIGLEPVDQAGDIYYDVRIKINDPDPQMKWGMTVEVKFPDATEE